jgi:hypothetical protein
MDALVKNATRCSRRDALGGGGRVPRRFDNRYGSGHDKWNTFNGAHARSSPHPGGWCGYNRQNCGSTSYHGSHSHTTSRSSIGTTNDLDQRAATGTTFGATVHHRHNETEPDTHCGDAARTYPPNDHLAARSQP